MPVNFNVQRELMPNTVLQVVMWDRHNLHLFSQRDFNTPSPVIGPSGRRHSASATGAAIRGLNPAYSSLNLADNMSDSKLQSLQTSLNRAQPGLADAASYTWSNRSITLRTYGLDGGGATSTPPTCRPSRISNFNRAHNFRLTESTHPPGQGFVEKALGGWQLTAATLFSRRPFSPASATNRVHNSTGSPTGRADVIAGCQLYPQPQTLPSGLIPPVTRSSPSGLYGNAGRDTLIGPGLWGVDSALLKDTRITSISEQFTVQFRAEAFTC